MMKIYNAKFADVTIIFGASAGYTNYRQTYARRHTDQPLKILSLSSMDLKTKSKLMSLK